MSSLRFAQVETSIGPMWIAESDVGVAAAIGSPRAARAVGNALARCPLFPAVPCHRVVRAADGWSGWGGDVALKRRLLTAERSSRRG
jgi:O-6-methylguanine DNA methyltransferase